jgi:small subunit ribosomal protein S9
VDPGFYTGAPAFHSVLYNIYLNTKALGTVKHSPPPPSPSSPPRNWLKREAISNITAEEISPLQYEEMIKRLSSLAAHPNMNNDAQKLLETYQSNTPGQSQVDSLRRVLQTDKSSVRAVGRRKSSTAVVQVRHGTGVVTINKQSFLKYFYRAEDRQQVLYPLILTNSLQRYDIHVSVQGGGLTGQQLFIST